MVIGEEQDKLDVVEVTDELVRTNRYGRRNYRNSIGADNRRHWHGEFIAEEEDVDTGEQEVTPEVFDQHLDNDEDDLNTEIAAEVVVEEEINDEVVEDTTDEPEEVVEEEDATPDEPTKTQEIRPEDRGNIADVSYDDDDDLSTDEPVEGVDSFFDPLKDVDGLDDVMSTDDQTVEVSHEEDEADAEERTDTVS
jgi:hypothetical protein